VSAAELPPTLFLTAPPTADVILVAPVAGFELKVLGPVDPVLG